MLTSCQERPLKNAADTLDTLLKTSHRNSTETHYAIVFKDVHLCYCSYSEFFSRSFINYISFMDSLIGQLLPSFIVGY